MHRARERQGTPRMRACAYSSIRVARRHIRARETRNNGQWKLDELLHYSRLLSRASFVSPFFWRACRGISCLFPLPSLSFSPPSFFVASTLTRNIRVKLWCALPLSADQLDHWSIDRSIGRRIIEIEPPSRDENNFLISYRPSFPSGLLELLAASAD